MGSVKDRTALSVIEDAEARGLLAKARELARAQCWNMPQQFDNEANAQTHERTGRGAIPRVFIGWQSIRGSMDTLAACEDGRLPALLAARAVSFDVNVEVDAAGVLPG